MLTYEDVKNNSAVRTYIQRADESLTALGYTEHSFAHVTAVAENAAYILSTLGYPERTVELAKIAGYFNVSVDHLLGKEEKPAAPKDGELVKDELIGFYGDVKEHLTEGDIEDIKTLMKLRAELNRSKE